MEILIGTKNAYKSGEMVSFLEGVPNLEIHFLKDQDFDLHVEEDGESLKENACKKAIEISKETNYLTLTSDGGVDLPGLGENWEFLRNQRFIGENKTDLQKAKKVLEIMKDLKDEDRKAEYHLALAIALNGKLLWVEEAITEKGYITQELVDEDITETMWMGHIWFYPEFGKVFNKLTEFEKKKVRKQSKNLKKSLQEFLLDNNF